MTSWTKTADASTSFTKVSDVSTTYTDDADVITPWGAFGGLLYLATEGSRELIMTEDSTDYIVVSRGVESDTWTDVDDSSTSWTKVIDA